MTRNIIIGAAQLGPISRLESRSSAVNRMIKLMDEAKQQGVELIVFPELALTTFFPRWYIEDQVELDLFFETEMPNPETIPLFKKAAELSMGFYLGFAELIKENGKNRHFNTSILVDDKGSLIGKYRKIHLPGHFENEPDRAFQHLEKRYFETGNLGFPTFEAFGGQMGMCLCNDRRWPETFRMLGLQGAELVMLGYNTPAHYPPVPEHDHLNDFHNHLVMQAGAYQNGTWVVGVAKAGNEENCDLIGGTCIIAPTGEIVAECKTLGDELIVYQCDLDRCTEIKDGIFDFAQHREPENYKLITETKGVKIVNSD
ncbi:MAG: N-carbamoyl-D-amino-acid hydrolase [Rhodobacterales bacterium]|jgi:predicted amidohydrolase|tara:strand:- start:3478 stop:4419 length:942 start_codon:yes stop_codon:yes gene_type:complete